MIPDGAEKGTGWVVSSGKGFLAPIQTSPHQGEVLQKIASVDFAPGGN
jgi:hypothetical protein